MHPDERDRLLALGVWLPLPVCALVLVLALPLLVTKSLWLDEAWVADNVLRHSFDATSLRTTPIGFEALVVAAASLVGANNVGFRLVPLVFGLASIPLTYRLTRDVFASSFEASLAVLLLSTNLVFIVYCRTLKPYTADAFVALLLAVVALQVRKRIAIRYWIAYVALLVVAPLVSFGSLLMVPPAACAILLAILGQPARRKPLLVIWTALHLAFGVVLAVYWYFFLRQQRSSVLLAFWSGGFPPQVSAPGLLPWYAGQTRGLLTYFFAPLTPALAAVLTLVAVIGAVRLWRGGSRHILLLCLGPLVTAALASAVHLYPYGGIPGGGAGRILLCALPGLLVLAAGGLGSVYRLARRTQLPPLGWAILLVAFIPSFAAWSYNSTLQRSALPGDPSEETRALIQTDLIPGLQSGDDLFVSYGAADALQVYAPQFRRPHIVTPPMKIYRVHGVWEVVGTYPADVREALRVTHPAHLWLLLAHIQPRIQTALQRSVRRSGLVVSMHAAPGAVLERGYFPSAGR